MLMTHESFDAWLGGAHQWIGTPPRRARFWRLKLDDCDGIIELGFNQHARTAAAAYAIHSDRFDALVHGKKMKTGGILVVQAGQEHEPFKQAIAVPEDEGSLRRLLDTIAAEAPRFFAALPDLESVYAELLAADPLYSKALPNAPSLRQMFAAVLAFLLGKDWQPHIKESLEALQVEAARKWILNVKHRLEAASV